MRQQSRTGFVHQDWDLLWDLCGKACTGTTLLASLKQLISSLFLTDKHLGHQSPYQNWTCQYKMQSLNKTKPKLLFSFLNILGECLQREWCLQMVSLRKQAKKLQEKVASLRSILCHDDFIDLMLEEISRTVEEGLS